MELGRNPSLVKIMKYEIVSPGEKICLEFLVRYIFYFLALRTLTDFPTLNTATDLGLIIELYAFHRIID